MSIKEIEFELKPSHKENSKLRWLNWYQKFQKETILVVHKIFQKIKNERTLPTHFMKPALS